MTEINEKDTWNLSDIFSTNAECEATLAEAASLAKKLNELKESFLNTADDLIKAFELKESLELKLTSCFVYAKMLIDQDMSNPESKALYEKCDAVGNKIAENLAFFEPSLLTLDETTWLKFKKDVIALELYDFYMKNLFLEKKHILSEQEEDFLSKLNNLGDTFERTYDNLTVNDIRYKAILTPENEEIKADNTNYARALIHSDRNFRKTYFEALLGSYDEHINTIASLYHGSVKNDVFTASARHYTSALNHALDDDRVPQSVYENLINTVSENKKVLEAYLNYRKECLGLNDLHFYDLFVPLTKNVNLTYTFDEAKELVLNATKVLGEDYQKVLKEAFENRWIDKYPRPYKDSGAYAIHSYGYHPFSLMNFTGTLNDVFTIAHELGHVMHSYFSMKHQPFIYSDYSIFTAEVASTVNEQLLFHYIYNNTTDNEVKKYLLSIQLDNIRSTFFRQTLFADFEWQAHKKVETSEPLTPEILKDIYKNCYKRFHGESLVIDDTLLAEWARIPHFYRAYYVYQYATGISAAITISNKILSNEPNATANYLAFLKTGGSNFPIELLKIAGVDMASPEPVLKTLEEFSSLLSKLKTM